MISDKKAVNRLALLFTLMYMVSYITRINYGAVISEMVKDTGYSKSMLSMALTGSFITYGVGQIISGVLGDRFSPKKLLSIGLLLSCFMNVLIPLCSNPYQMLGVWCVNGFAQSFMWPPLVRMMTALLSMEDYSRVSVKVSWGSSFGTIIVYLVAPLLISTLGWKSVFLFSAAIGVLMLVIWQLGRYDVAPTSSVKREDLQPTEKKNLIRFWMIGILIAIVLMGLLRDGVTTWMPSYIGETYKLGSAVSILTGVVLPVFGIGCFQLSAMVYRKKPGAPLLVAALFFSLGAVSALFLNFVSGGSAILSVVFSALLTGSMHGVNLILISMLPPFFRDTGKVSTVSGVLNACTYIGSALSTYGTALLTEQFGWSVTLILWVAVAAVGAAICFSLTGAWKKTFLKR